MPKNNNEITILFNKFIQTFKKSSSKKYDLNEFYKAFTIHKNKENIKRFSQVFPQKKVVLLPQCLRKVGKCKVKEIGNQYRCRKCGACKIDKIIKESQRLKYLGSYIFKGGKAVSSFLDKIKPKAVLGIACYYEGSQGIVECEKREIPVQFVPLTREGCANTDVDLNEVFQLLNLNNFFNS